MSKATPGPWTVRNSREVFKGTRRICHVNAGESLTIGADIERAAHNARLIAAAPELLDALKDVLNNCLDSERLSVAYAKARAAISKAEGA